MTRTHLAAAFLLAILPSAGSAADDSWVDYAKVTEVRPLLEARQVPVRRELCDQSPAPAQESTGFLKELDARAGPSDWMERDARARQGTQQLCRTVSAMEWREEVVAYEVCYEYAGHQYTKRMDHDPGNRLQVRVKLNAQR